MVLGRNAGHKVAITAVHVERASARRHTAIQVSRGAIHKTFFGYLELAFLHGVAVVVVFWHWGVTGSLRPTKFGGFGPHSRHDLRLLSVDFLHPWYGGKNPSPCSVRWLLGCWLGFGLGWGSLSSKNAGGIGSFFLAFFLRAPTGFRFFCVGRFFGLGLSGEDS